MKQTVDYPCVLLRHDQRIWLMYLMPWGLWWGMCVCVFLLLFSTSVVSDSFATPWIVVGSSVHRISQAGILEWVVISFYKGSFRFRDQNHISCISGGFFTSEPPGKPHILEYWLWYQYKDTTSTNSTLEPTMYWAVSELSGSQFLSHICPGAYSSI